MNLFDMFLGEVGECIYRAYPCMIIDDDIAEGFFYPATIEIIRYWDHDSLGWYRGKVFDDDEYDGLGPTFDEYFGQG